MFIWKLGIIPKLGQLIGYLVRNNFTGKVYRKSAIKTSDIPLLTMVNKTKQNNECIQEI